MAVLGTESGQSAFSKRQKYERLRAQLENERSSFKAHWRDLNDYILPRRGRFFVSDSNKGDRRNLRIYDSTATLAVRTLRSGMMAGVTSPARPWFKLATQSPELNENEAVKKWLHDVSNRMSAVFLKSNLYNVLPVAYGDIGTFGTAAIGMEEDFNGVVRFSTFPIGSYMIANNDKLMVDVFVREFRMTVRQIINRFAQDPQNPGKINWDNISRKARSLWDSNNAEAWIDVCHVISPNDEYDPRRLNSKYKKYISVYYEKGTSGSNTQGFTYTGVDQNKFLSEKGYDYFPILAPRWEITGEDVYGTDCPGMSALGDIKQLQVGEKRALQAIEKMINPTMVGPTSLRNQKTTLLPGDITYADIREGQQGYRPAHEVNFNIQAMEMKQDQVRNRIQRSFFEDLFLMLASSDRRQITAREIEERHEEKLLAVGPVLEQLNQDLLDPLIDNTFAIMQEQQLIPPAPEEIQGSELKVEYISIMAQAQKLVGLGGIERFTGFASNVIAQSPETGDKIDADQLLDVYGDLVSLPPGIVRSDEDVAGIRDQRAQAQAQQMQMQQASEAARTARDLSQAQVGEENALELLAGGANG